MLVEIGADFIPVVFLTTDTQEASPEVTVSEVDEAAKGESEIEAEQATSDAAVDTQSAESKEAEDDLTEGELLDQGDTLDGEAGYSDETMGGSMAMMEETSKVKDPLLSSPVFVGGISLGVLVVGGVLGFILAKKKIKKGIEIYEDI